MFRGRGIILGGIGLELMTLERPNMQRMILFTVNTRNAKQQTLPVTSSKGLTFGTF